MSKATAHSSAPAWRSKWQLVVVGLVAVAALLQPGSVAAFPDELDQTLGFSGTLSFYNKTEWLDLPGTLADDFYTLDPAIVDSAVQGVRVFGINEGADARTVQRVSGPANNWIRYGTPAEMGGAAGTAHLPCHSGINCVIRVSVQGPWQPGTGCPTSTNHDQVGVIVHEMGHWFGAYHTLDIASTGRNQTATMDAGVPVGTCSRRTLEQDDVNALRHAEPFQSQIASNPSFEKQHPGSNSFYNGNLHFKFLPGTTGQGSATRWWDPASAYHGSLLGQFNGGSGTASSLYQDIYPDGFGADILTPSVVVRNDTNQWATAQLVVWELFTPSGNVPHVTNCSLPPNSGWMSCTAPSPISIQQSTDWLRLQVYNYSTGNMSVDQFRMTAND